MSSKKNIVLEEVNLEMDKLHEQFVRSYVKIINYKVSMQMYGIFVRSVCTMEFKVMDIKYRYCDSCCIESE